MDISGSELPNNVGCNCVEGNGQKKSVGRHDVRRSSGAKPPKSPESTKKRQKTKTLAKEREVVSLDEVFKKEEFNGRAYGVGFRGKSIRFVDKKSADACREFAMNKLKGRPKIATQERQLHHSDRSVIAFSQATQDDLEKNVFLYMIDKNGEMVPLSQDQKESLKLQYQAMQAFQDNVQTQTNDVMPQQDPIANDEQNIQNQPMQPQNLVANDWQQVQQQQENIQKQEGKVMSSLNQQPGDVVQFDEQRQTNAGAMAVGAQSRQAVVHGNVSRADQLCQFIDQSVQCIQNMNVQNMKSPNDTAELWQCLHMMFGYVQLIYAYCSELETVDNDRALQINDALLEILGFFSSGNQQVQQLQAALRQQGPTLQNMQSVLNLLTVAQNQGISASQMQGMLTYVPNGGNVSQPQNDIQSRQQMTQTANALSLRPNVSQSQIKTAKRRQESKPKRSASNRRIAGLTAVAGAGAVAAGAAAVKASTMCYSAGSAIASVQTVCFPLLGMGPIGWATVGLGLGATAIGGAMYLLRKEQ